MEYGSQEAPVRLTLPARPEAAHRVRRELAGDGVADDLRPAVALLATEAVANSVRHAGLSETDRIEVWAWLDRDRARVEVHDYGPGFDPDIRYRAPGYGLRIIDAVASKWGAGPRNDGWTVWFEVDRERATHVEPGAARPLAA
jgi:anti-sigma regulatory factor (Ser/Thr protein kinase)